MRPSQFVCPKCDVRPSKRKYFDDPSDSPAEAAAKHIIDRHIRGELPWEGEGWTSFTYCSIVAIIHNQKSEETLDLALRENRRLQNKISDINAEVLSLLARIKELKK